MQSGLVFVPLLTAFTGWLVGWLLIRMLFYPKPQNRSWLSFQGLFPAKQQELAGKLGKLARESFFSLAPVEETLTNPANFEKLMPVIETHVDDFLRIKLPAQMPMIGMLVGERTINELKSVFITELKELFPVVMKNYMNGLQNNIDPGKLLEDKIASLPAGKMEEMIGQLIGKPAKKLAFLGAGIGFLIGLLQVFILLNA